MSIPIDPTEDATLRNIAKAQLHITVKNSASTLWVDSVQLEEKEYATPFVDHFRLPHDETIVLLTGKLSIDERPARAR